MDFFVMTTQVIRRLETSTYYQDAKELKKDFFFQKVHTKSYVQFIVQLLALSGKIVCMHAIPRSENGRNMTSKFEHAS